MNDHAGIAAPGLRRPDDAAIRQDIEGLRAVAIVLVLLFHFDIAGFMGGFAGVDVFFVISGFLMTSILLGSRRPIDLREVCYFYRKRVWRIFPAYYVTLAAVLLSGFVILIPVDLDRLGRSTTPSVLFHSNVFFTDTASYFATSAFFTPLLHTWSLGVEVQFYLAWPFVILFARRLPFSGRLGLFGAVTLASFALCLGLTWAESAAAFYWLPPRLWQFGFGAMVFVILSKPSPFLRRLAAEPVAVLAATTLVATALLVDRETPWPGLAAVAPTAATALLILAGGVRQGLVTAWLGGALPRFLGRISYSLYLVHWPVVVFLFYLLPEGPPVWLRLAGVALSVLLAMAMFHAVEAPTRGIGRVRSLAWDRPTTVLLGAAVGLVAVGAVFTATRGLPVRWGAEALADNALIASRPVHATNCPNAIVFADRRACLLGDATAIPDTLLWGDSHAQHFAEGFEALGAARKAATILAATDACPPAAGLAIVSSSWRTPEDCLDRSAATLRAALNTGAIKTVVLAARWAIYAENSRFGGETGRSYYAIDRDNPARDRATSRRVLEAHLRTTIAALRAAGKAVILLDQVPEMGADAGRCVAVRRSRSADASGCDIDRARVDGRQSFSAPMLRRIAAGHPGMKLLDPKHILCDARRCVASLDGRPAYRDDDHINPLASRLIVERLFGASAPP